MSLPLPPDADEPTSAHLSPLLFQLVYCSRAAASVDEAEVARILAASHRHNPERGITGLLVFGSGIFFQWLEGSREQVTKLMAILRADPRHHDVVALTETEEVRDRLFPDWDMERVSADDIRDVLVDALDTADSPGSREMLTQMIEQLETGELAALGAARGD